MDEKQSCNSPDPSASARAVLLLIGIYVNLQICRDCSRIHNHQKPDCSSKTPFRAWNFNTRPSNGWPSSPGELHPEALSEPYVIVSAHTAPKTEPDFTNCK